MKLIIIMQSFIILNCGVKCQTIKWGDIYDCNLSKMKIDPNQDINCADFFQIKDSCKSNSLITWNWTGSPKIENMDSVLNNIVYPKNAERYHICGKIFVRCLIDKNGRLYCYKVLSELGDIFNKEAEKAIRSLRFNAASMNNKPVVYEYVVPINFQFKEEMKKQYKQGSY